MIKLSPELRTSLEKQHYELVGNHSAVEICSWTKKSLLNKGHCYKQKFYGINSHRCCQMTPSVGFCNQRCLFCWRAIELTQANNMKGKVDDPEFIVNDCIRAQRRKLTGFGGNADINKNKFKEAQEPMHFAISLSGEPTLYSKLPLLVKELHKKGKTTFIVTNGTNPLMLRRLIKERASPTQLYVSLDAPNKELYKKIDHPQIRGTWEKIMQSLGLMKKFKRNVLRITAVKGLNMIDAENYGSLIKKFKPLFVEIKAYMWLGWSRKRLKSTNMPTHLDVKKFSREIAKHCGYKIIDEQKASRVCLLAKKDFKARKMKF